MSLDKAMEYKNKKHLRQKNRKRAKFLKMSKNSSSGNRNGESEDKPEFNVFEFINKTLLKKDQNGGNKNKNNRSNNSNIKHSGGPSTSSAASTDGLIMLETHNKIQEVEKTVAKLRQSLARNKNRYV